MTANVITYRDRSAAREVAKALGFSREQEDQLARQLGHFRYDLERGDPKLLERELATAGFDPEEPRNRLFAVYWRKIQNLPRHLGQHSGGMVIAAGRLDEIVPLEPAAMPGRTIVQWDKDDCADLGIIKVDLLGLGMLNALEEAIPIIRDHERVSVDLAHLPADDPKVYAMLRAADTVGVFQVESRAQMASLPRNAPTRFYDLVIQVAIIRPGPITGGMVHPFFERRRGREKVTYFDPCLEPILKRTLGIPLFQEQLLRIAMTAAGFSGGEAEELRRAMGFKRSVERMEAIEARLRVRHGGARHHRRQSGPDRAVDHLVRALRLPRVARRLVRAHRLRLGLSQVLPPDRLSHRAAQRLADGLLPPGLPGQGRPAPRRRCSTDRCELLRVAVLVGGAEQQKRTQGN